MDPGEDGSDSCSAGPPPKRKKFSALEVAGGKDNEFEETSGGESDGDDGSLFDFDAGQLRVPPSVLCAKCQFICDNWPLVLSRTLEDDHIDYPHCDSSVALEASAKRGCSLCAQFLASVDQERLEDSRQRRQEKQDDGIGDLGGRIKVQNAVFDRKEVNPIHRKHCWILHLSFGHGVRNFFVDIVPALGPAFRTPSKKCFLTSRDALPLAEQWMRRCGNTHRLCNAPIDDFLPTRLISVHSTQPYLFLTSQLKIKPKYATLSHCWGNIKYLTLTRATIENFQQRIPPEALPKTFHDAIGITQEFGIDYLWIDSLCIVQDDNDDWDREASSMASVYGSSALNIAASGASDGRIGCFFKRAASLKCQVEMTVCGEKVLYNVVPRLMYERSLARMPLSKRGWALQERVLPRRTLHFTSTDVFWECLQKTACETFPDGLPAAISYRPYGRNSFRKGFISKSMWMSLVEMYSECHLTKSCDKLVAISGLARSIQLQTKEQYVAGLWREELELQLCWEVSFDRFNTTAPPYRPPSWSWASVDSQIKFRNIEKYGPGCWNIKILQVHVNPSGPNPLGEIKSGILRLSCEVLIHVNVKITADGFYMVINATDVEAKMGLDYEDMHTTFDQSNQPITRLYNFYALPVRGYNSGSRIIGLLLELTGKNGEFRRVGIFRLTGDQHLREFEECVKDTKCHAKKEEYYRIRKDKFGQEHRIIAII